jgi:hypothetical protein
MTDKLMGRVIEPHRYARIKPDLAHENKKRENRIPIIGDNVVDISGKEIDGAIKAVQVGETDGADQGHGKTQLYARGEKHQE